MGSNWPFTGRFFLSPLSDCWAAQKEGTKEGHPRKLHGQLWEERPGITPAPKQSLNPDEKYPPIKARSDQNNTKLHRHYKPRRFEHTRDTNTSVRITASSRNVETAPKQEALAVPLAELLVEPRKILERRHWAQAGPADTICTR